MPKSKGVRKSILKDQKEFRKLHQGTPRRKTQGAAMIRKMREFNRFIDKAIKEGKITGHQEAGLPEVIGDVDVKIEHIKGEENETVESIQEETKD